jgi:hypothetical protein
MRRRIGRNEVQRRGTTTLAATSTLLAVASGHAVAINGRLIQGLGTIRGKINDALVASAVLATDFGVTATGRVRPRTSRNARAQGERANHESPCDG